jgi:Rrf2 family protein
VQKKVVLALTRKAYMLLKKEQIRDRPMRRDHSFTTAIHLLAALAYQAPALVSSATLARGMKTNPSLVRRVVGKLVRAGLVTTVQGKSGGITLAKPASRIDLEQVYQAMRDGPLFESFEKEPFSPCPVSCGIGGVLEAVYQQLEADLEKGMKKIKLSRIVSALKRDDQTGETHEQRKDRVS